VLMKKATKRGCAKCDRGMATIIIFSSALPV
jgi:hypothetical protein